MKITDREAIASDGMMIRRIGENSEGYTRCTLLEGETAEQFEETEQFTVVESVGYDEEVNALIRQRYTESQEFAILRQKDNKPDEYKLYYDYCEECKSKVKARIASL